MTKDGERIARMEEKIQHLVDALKKHNDAAEAFHERFDQYLAQQNEAEEAIQKENDSRYASKPVEWIVYSGVGIILTGLLVAVCNFFFKILK